jgi:hypothetical protein
MIRISLSLPEELLKEVDKICLKEHYERSELIRSGIRLKLAQIDYGYPSGVKRIDTPFTGDPTPAPYTGDPIPNPSTTIPTFSKSKTFNKLKEQFNEPIYSKEDL